MKFRRSVNPGTRCSSTTLARDAMYILGSLYSIQILVPSEQLFNLPDVRMAGSHLRPAANP